MKYFSLRDIKQEKPFDFGPETVELPLFLSFYAWWHELSIPKLSALSTDATKAESTEALYELFYKAKKEYPLLEKPQSFFPDWSIFSSLNAWVNSILSEYFTPIQKIVDSTIDKTGPQKLSNIEYLSIDDCLRKHQVEIEKQPELKPAEPYAQVNKKIKESQYALQRFCQHREFVCRKEEPKGEPTFFDSQGIVYYDPPTREQVRIFDSHLNRIDADIHAEEARHKKLSKTLRNQFFLARKDEDQTEFQQSRQKRTDQAVEVLKNKVI